ncbi:hypothetical protein EAS64_36655 [Trebonia kvetii]|uniref:ABC transporter ATP-binding protein n=1 Tax=Trebonia kvetii TaxID=2480626 RepID=A0A6P2BUI2_9ACTN|nr:hypothetical protein [Trebonia kvetii]TVZ00873.1 hypothetical protein EAS64_36655 [Trebonia kvetii]
MRDSALVRALDLSKVYPARGKVPEFRAVDGIGFELRRGETVPRPPGRRPGPSGVSWRWWNAT